MRDLVETVIAQVMKQDLQPAPGRRVPARVPGIHKFVQTMNDVAIREKSARPHPAQEHRDKHLWKVSRKFEAMMFQQMMSAMRKTIPSSGFIHTGFAEDVHGAMFDQAVAKAVSRQGNFGIANSIYRQLSHESVVRRDSLQANAIQATTDSSDKQIEPLVESRIHTGR